MARVKGTYKITWEIPDEDWLLVVTEDWSDDEILGYFEDNGKKVKQEMNTDDMNWMEWVDD